MASPAAILNILITANSTQATAALTRTDAQLKKTAATAQKSSAGMASTMAKGAKVGGLAVAGLGIASVVAAAKFESAFAEVRKTVDASEKQFGRLEKGIRNLAKTIPISANELAELAGQAGALGIKAKDLVSFTKTAAELGIATDLSATDAANALARLSNIMGTSSKDFRRLGSTLVELGNKGASTESEIAEMALRISGAGKQVGLTEAQVLSFSSALSSVGVRAEAGGSSISRAFITMAEAVDKGGADLAQFADVAGMSTDRFAKGFRDNAAKAMISFISGLKGIKQEGGSVFSVLDDLELGEIRVRDALLRASGAGKLFNDQLKIGSGEWKRNTALTEEAQRRYDTTASKFQVFKNRVNDLFITIGQFLDPATKGFLNTLNQLLVGKGGIAEAIKAVVQFAKESEVLGAAWEVMGRIATKVWGGVKVVIQGFVTFLQGAVDLIAGILTLDLGRAWDGVKGIFKSSIQQIIGVLRVVTAPFRGAVEAIAAALKGPLVDVWKFITQAFKDGADFILGVVTTILDGMVAMADAGSKIPGPIGDMWDSVQAGAEDARDSINGFRETLRNTETAAEKTKNNVSKSVSSLAGIIGSEMRGAGNAYRDSWGGIVDTTRDKGGQAANVTGQQLGKAADIGRDRSGDLRKGVKANIDGLASAVAQGMGRIVGNTNKALKAFGVKPVNFAVVDGKKTGTSGLQRGGPAASLVPGAGTGDKVHALLEPGEVVINRNAAAAMGGAEHVNRINSIIPRFATGGQVGGGLNFALGPYTIPPIQYDANHAGGNSHVHITGTTTPWVVAIGKQLQRMGWMVGEHPAFGGVNAQHSATGGHYDALAIDANTAADETRAEVAAVARLLQGKGGALGAVAERIARVLLKGPDGPLKDMGQSALDKVRKAANAFIGKQAPRMSEENFAGGAYKGPLDRIFPHPTTVANPGVALSASQVSGLMGKAGLPSAMLGVAQRESGLHPGIVGYDPGGTRGLGLWQITTGFNDDVIRRFGGETQMFNPWVNAQAAKTILDRQPSAWAASGGLQRGGIVGEGIGALGLRQAVKLGPDVLGKWVAARTAGPGFYDADGNLAGDPGKLREQVDTFASYADLAGQLGFGDTTGTFRGGTEQAWLERELDALLPLRNQLILAEQVVVRHREAMVELIARAQEYLAKLRRQIADQERRRQRLERQIKQGRIDRKEAVEAAKDQLREERDKPRNKRDRKNIGLLEDFIKSGGGHPNRGLRATLAAVKNNIEIAQGRATSVTDTLIPALSGKRDALSTTRGDLLTELETVQGPVPVHNLLSSLPPIGTLGGEILSAQARIREMGLDQPEVRDTSENTSQLLEAARELNQQLAERLAVSESQARVFQNTPFMGAFAAGGVAMVGERGPELAHLPSGTRIHSADDTQSMLNPNIQIQFFEGERRADVFVNGRRHAAKIVQEGSRGYGRRVLPGAGGR